MHIPKYRMPLNQKMKVSATVHTTINSDKNEMFALNEISKCKKKKIKLNPTSGNQSNNIGDLDGDSDGADMSMSIVKSLGHCMILSSAVICICTMHLTTISILSHL